jgi:basic amino acid/polyamine antiporter, APA family
MVEFTAPVFWLFFMLSGLALFILRRREPAMPRPFRVPLYPVLPLLFVLSCCYVLYSSIVHAQTEHATHVAIGVMLSGAIVLLLLRRRR